jgi:hypothetical protein
MEPKHEIRLHTDPSDRAITAVLTHIQDGVERPISFASRQLNTVGKKMSVTEKELLAVLCWTSLAPSVFRCGHIAFEIESDVRLITHVD